MRSSMIDLADVSGQNVSKNILPSSHTKQADQPPPQAAVRAELIWSQQAMRVRLAELLLFDYAGGGSRVGC